MINKKIVVFWLTVTFHHRNLSADNLKCAILGIVNIISFWLLSGKRWTDGPVSHVEARGTPKGNKDDKCVMNQTVRMCFVCSKSPSLSGLTPASNFMLELELASDSQSDAGS